MCNSIFSLFHIEEFGGIKLFIIIFHCLTSLIFWLWTKNIFITIILHFSLLLNSVALGYIDIFFAPTLILSIWAIKEQKLIFFTLFYSIACLTKWQPIIIAPFIVLYILNIKQVNQWKQVDFKNILLKVVFPAISLIIITLYVFGFIPILSSFKKALSHGFLSGNALNFNWILTHLLHVFYPERFGALIEGQAELIITRSLIITLVPKLLFFLFYTMTLVSFFRRNKTFETMINFSLIGNLAYFIFNTGVHENHLFLITILSIILFCLSRNYLFLMMVCIIISNINLFVFYGIDGRGLKFSRVIAHRMDIALLLSIFNVSFFLLLWGQTLDLIFGKNWTVTNPPS
jgi:hypothetical protein